MVCGSPPWVIVGAGPTAFGWIPSRLEPAVFTAAFSDPRCDFAWSLPSAAPSLRQAVIRDSRLAGWDDRLSGLFVGPWALPAQILRLNRVVT